MINFSHNRCYLCLSPQSNLSLGQRSKNKQGISKRVWTILPNNWEWIQMHSQFLNFKFSSNLRTAKRWKVYIVVKKGVNHDHLTIWTCMSTSMKFHNKIWMSYTVVYDCLLLNTQIHKYSVAVLRENLLRTLILYWQQDIQIMVEKTRYIKSWLNIL